MTDNAKEGSPIQQKVGVITVTIEVNGLRISRTFEHATIQQEAGVEILYHGTTASKPEILHTPHNRLTIQAWNGFKEWDDFIPRSERILIE